MRSQSLFVYGTLESPSVFRAVTGRSLGPTPAVALDHLCRHIRGEDYPGMVPRRGTRTLGSLYRGLGARDLARLDRFEGRQYERRPLTVLAPGLGRVESQAYVIEPRLAHRLGEAPWRRAHFARHGVDPFLRRIAGLRAELR